MDPVNTMRQVTKAVSRCTTFDDVSSDLKHRHDIGHPDHGPVTTEQLTAGLQGLLGICIAVSCALVIWALLAAT